MTPSAGRQTPRGRNTWTKVLEEREERRTAGGIRRRRPQKSRRGLVGQRGLKSEVVEARTVRVRDGEDRFVRWQDLDANGRHRTAAAEGQPSGRRAAVERLQRADNARRQHKKRDGEHGGRAHLRNNARTPLNVQQHTRTTSRPRAGAHAHGRGVRFTVTLPHQIGKLGPHNPRQGAPAARWCARRHWRGRDHSRPGSRGLAGLRAPLTGRPTKIGVFGGGGSPLRLKLNTGVTGRESRCCCARITDGASWRIAGDPFPRRVRNRPSLLRQRRPPQVKCPESPLSGNRLSHWRL